jgi:oxygen-independent coproporphyrinogen-3 oxidase
MDKYLGVYIHLPFCVSRCAYCDFCSTAGQAKRMPKYQDALLTHIRESAPQLAPYLIDTVYFGGGTPSYYGARRIVELLDALKTNGQLLKSAEITVECNPDTVRLGELRALRKAGVDRLSIGMQSANDDILRLIGRRHDFRQVERAVALARRAGFDNLSLDLIYGLPSQTPGDWADSLSRAIALRPEHLSCYGLKLEEGTPMYKYKDSPFLPSDDEQADMYLYAVETLQGANYAQYEISNFALQGFESRHNRKYWKLGEYMGFGASAHSFVSGVRYSYIADMQGYIDGVAGVGDVKLLDEYEEVTPQSKAAEYVMLGMRTAEGISRKEYRSIYLSDFEPIEDVLRKYEKKGWVREKDGRWSFTATGFLLSNPLIGGLLDAQTQRTISAFPWLGETETEQVSLTV